MSDYMSKDLMEEVVKYSSTNFLIDLKLSSSNPEDQMTEIDILMDHLWNKKRVLFKDKLFAKYPILTSGQDVTIIAGRNRQVHATFHTGLIISRKTWSMGVDIFVEAATLKHLQNEYAFLGRNFHKISVYESSTGEFILRVHNGTHGTWFIVGIVKKIE